MSGSGYRRLVHGAGSDEGSATQIVDDRGTDAASAWSPVDLAAVLAAGIEPVTPDYLLRSDGALLLYAGKLNVIFAAPEAGKTWIAIFAIAQRVKNAVKHGGGVVAVFIDYEDDATTFLSRLAAAGIDPADAIRHTCYYSVAQAIGSAPHDLEGLDTAEIVVIDTTNSAMTLDGLDPLSNANALSFINDVRRLRGATRAAWLLLDHEPISTGPGRRQALGAQSKLGAVDGAQYRAVAVEQPRPGGRGVIDLYVTKDRPGAVRAVSGPPKDGIQHAARITMNPLGSSSNRFVWAILEPGGGQGDTELLRNDPGRCRRNRLLQEPDPQTRPRHRHETPQRCHRRDRGCPGQ